MSQSSIILIDIDQSVPLELVSIVNLNSFSELRHYLYLSFCGELCFNYYIYIVTYSYKIGALEEQGRSKIKYFKNRLLIT